MLKENNLDIVKDIPELRKLIIENPDLPICVLVGQDAACEEFSRTYCTVVNCYVGEILDCALLWTDLVYTDRDEFEESIVEQLSENEDTAYLSEKDFEKEVKKNIKEYERYWKKAIIISAEN